MLPHQSHRSAHLSMGADFLETFLGHSAAVSRLPWGREHRPWCKLVTQVKVLHHSRGSLLGAGAVGITQVHSFPCTLPGARIRYHATCWEILSMKVCGKRFLMGRTFVLVSDLVVVSRKASRLVDSCGEGLHNVDSVAETRCFRIWKNSQSPCSGVPVRG